MGIELPRELTDVAAEAGVRWPQADEEVMRQTAQAWREAGRQLTTLATDSDHSARQALDAVQGGTADAARRQWDGFVSADGHLPVTVEGCTAAADRLEHAADQIGAAKVEMVRQLVTLAKNSDAAHQAAAAGHPTALLGLDTAVRGTAANLAHVHDTLAQAVRPETGVDIGGVRPLAQTSPGGQPLLALATGAPSGPAGPVRGLLGGAGDLGASVLDPVAGRPPQPLDVTGAAAHVMDTTLGPGPGVGPPGVDAGPGAAPGPVADGSAGQPGGPGFGLTGPGSTLDGPVAGVADAGGPLNPVGPVNPVGALPGHPPFGGAQPWGQQPVVDAGSTGPIVLDGGVHGTPGPALGTPDVVHTSSAGELPPPPAPAAQPDAGPASGAMPPVAGGGIPGGAPTPAPVPPAFSGVLADPAGGPPPSGPAAPAVATPPGAPGNAVAAGRPGPDAPPQPPVRPAPSAPVPSGPVPSGPVPSAPVAPNPTAGRAPSAAPPPAVVDLGYDRRGARGLTGPDTGPVVGVNPNPGGQPPAARPSSAGSRRSDGTLALFVAGMFPIGHLPVPASRPARQLPIPAPEQDFAAGLRFPPQDHPRSGLVTDTDALRAGADGRDPLRLPPGRPATDPAVAALAEGHDPLGGRHERDWDRCFLVRPGDAESGRSTEYAWPPAEAYPEGGVDAGEPVVLDPEQVLDRFGGEEGRVLAPDGTWFRRRSLPPEHLESGYHRYRVLRPLPVWRTVSAPWFGQPGGGVRYRATYPVADLVALGWLADITEHVTEHTTEHAADGGSGAERTSG